MKRAQLAIAVAALPVSAGVGYLCWTSERDDAPRAIAVTAVVVGWSFVASGLIAWRQRPENRLGPVMVLVGFLWFAHFLGEGDGTVAFTVGTLLENAYLAAFVYLILSFPTGRLERRIDRRLFGAAVVLCFLELIWFPFAEPSEVFCGSCARNGVLIEPHNEFASTVLDLQRVLGVGFSLFTAGLLVARWRATSAAQRRSVAPVLWAASALFLQVGIGVINDIADEPLGNVPDLVLAGVFAATPLAVLAVLLRQRLARGEVARLVVELRGLPQMSSLRDALARTLRDPTLQLAYWVPATSRWVDAAGAPVALPDPADEDRAATLVERGGEPIAALIHDPALREDRELVESVCAAAALALENERLQADLRARLDELRASRARLAEAAETERRRIERDLHDGAQQRLVSIAMTLGLAEARLAGDPVAAGPFLREARDSLMVALQELRELSHGIHPGVLSERGLGPALEELARGAVLPVRLSADVGRLPQPVETAAYFVVSESLANIAKHAHATEAAVTATSDGAALVLEIADDGIGGAAFAGGSGLRGLADRVEALGGRLTVSSPPGRGTTLRAEIPCGETAGA